MSCFSPSSVGLSSPFPPRAQRVVGRGRGWGAKAPQPRRYAGEWVEAPQPGHEVLT